MGENQGEQIMDIMKILRNWFAVIMSVALVIFIVVVVFLQLGWKELSPAFYLELSLIIMATIYIKLFWTPWVEAKIDEETGPNSLTSQKTTYDDLIETEIEEKNLITTFEKSTVIFDDINREHYVKNKMGYRSKENFKEEYEKYRKESLKIRPVKSTEVLTRANSKNLYDSKDNYRTKKVMMIFTSVLLGIGFAVLSASVLIDENTVPLIQKFATLAIYLSVIIFNIIITIMTTYSLYKHETIKHLKKLRSIVKRFIEMSNTEGYIEAYLKRIEEETNNVRNEGTVGEILLPNRPIQTD